MAAAATIGILALAAAALAWAMAFAVYRARPHGAQNRRLAVVLSVHGVLISAWWGMGNLTTDPRAAWAFLVISFSAAAAQAPLYLHFIITLPDTMVSRFHRPGASRLLLPMAVAFALAVILFPGSLFESLDHDAAFWTVHFGTGFLIVGQAIGTVLVAALVFSFQAWRRAPAGSAAKERAKALVLAFGISDAHWAVFMFVLMPIYLLLENQTMAFITTLTPVLVSIAYVLLIGIGILRTQLFDIRVQVRRTVAIGVIVATFAGSFFIVNELLEGIVADRFGNLAGLGAAVVLALGLRPIQKLAGLIADRLVPGHEGPELDRQRAFFETLITDAWADGEPTPEERAMLEQVRERFGISAQRMARLEAKARHPRRSR